MNISIQRLLSKIEKELNEAKVVSAEGSIRERVHAIKSLCELILEDANEMERRSDHLNIPITSQQVQPTTIQQTKRLEMDDEANGDSLFDF